jgi:predicted metal-binding transcription factor (methanogenesis marker protein 9)
MKPSEPKPTKDDVLKRYGVAINVDGNDYMKYGCTLNKIKLAMQEYADLYHKEKLREELIKFVKWYNRDFDESMSSTKIVDKYLNPKK